MVSVDVKPKVSSRPDENKTLRTFSTPLASVYQKFRDTRVSGEMVKAGAVRTLVSVTFGAKYEHSASDAVNLVLSLGTALLSNSCSPSWRRILKSFLCQNVAYCFSLFLFSFFPRTVGVSLLAADAIYETKPVLGEFSLKKKNLSSSYLSAH